MYIDTLMHSADNDKGTAGNGLDRFEKWPPTTHPPIPYIGGGIDRTQAISTVAVQNNVWEKCKPGTLTFILGASRGGGGLVHLAQL